MPSIRTIRVLPGVWLAFNENDYHEILFVTLGFTANHAANRCFRKMP